MEIVISWKIFSYTSSHLLLPGHKTRNNETASWQNVWADNIAKSMMSEGNSVLQPTNVDWQPPLQRGLMNFKLQNFPLCNKLKISPLGNS